jgi:hypothetical protein
MFPSFVILHHVRQLAQIASEGSTRMMIECPHCRRRVLPSVSGECPACHENTNDAGSANPDESLLSITEATMFPNLCCTCIEPTTNRVKVQRTGKLAGSGNRTQQLSSASESLILFFGGIVGLVMLLFSKLSRQHEAGLGSFISYVPQCKSCAAKRKIEPASVDLEHHRLSILVSRRFGEAVTELNQRRTSMPSP